jgi:hypothetical protein
MTAEVFYEPPGAVHPTSRNVSPDKPLKIVVFMVAEKQSEHGQRTGEIT